MIFEISTITTFLSLSLSQYKETEQKTKDPHFSCIHINKIIPQFMHVNITSLHLLEIEDILMNVRLEDDFSLQLCITPSSWSLTYWMMWDCFTTITASYLHYELNYFVNYAPCCCLLDQMPTNLLLPLERVKSPSVWSCNSYQVWLMDTIDKKLNTF